MLADVTRILLCAEGDRQSQGCRTALVPLLLVCGITQGEKPLAQSEPMPAIGCEGIVEIS